MITVFTPSYNRAHLLPRLFDSLLRQSYTDFEWIVVDDGSIDDTESVMKGIIEQSDSLSFSIKYIKQNNGGKHRAVNRGVEEARGELFFIADSDDILLPDSLRIVHDEYETIKNNHYFAGVCGLDVDFDNHVIGSGLPKAIIDSNAFDIRYKYHVLGDLKEVFRTEVLKEFPFPDYTGERFCPEALVWNRIARKYQLRYINKPIYMVEYQEGGLTDNITKIRHESPKATCMCYKEMLMLPIPLKYRVKALLNYLRFRFL